eukprot:TRINITY_DN1088_c0_g1_i1.p1 TRINITY_DN1088_c0_g1~~TRINITY_DN1088_c0_g1_i1.p1  ORF type:complete len:1220 (+),score=465.85 TRINITY_DN1088_c0_g1_i1:98-3661(+)
MEESPMAMLRRERSIRSGEVSEESDEDPPLFPGDEDEDDEFFSPNLETPARLRAFLRQTMTPTTLEFSRMQTPKSSSSHVPRRRSPRLSSTSKLSPTTSSASSSGSHHVVEYEDGGDDHQRAPGLGDSGERILSEWRRSDIPEDRLISLLRGGATATSELEDEISQLNGLVERERHSHQKAAKKFKEVSEWKREISEKLLSVLQLLRDEKDALRSTLLIQLRDASIAMVKDRKSLADALERWENEQMESRSIISAEAEREKTSDEQKMEALKDENEELQGQVDQLGGLYVAFREEMDKYALDREKLLMESKGKEEEFQRQITSKDEEIHRLNIRAGEFFRKEKEYMSTIEELGSRVEDERAHIVQMKKLLEASADGTSEIEAEFSEQIEALKSEKKSIETQLVAAQKQRDEFRDDAASLSAELKAIHVKMEEERNDNEGTVRQLEKAKQDIHAFEDLIATMESKSLTMEQKSRDLDKALEEMHSENMRLEKGVRDLEEEVSHWKLTVRDLEVQKGHLEHSLEEQSSQYETLWSDFQSLDESKEALSLKLEESKTECANLMQEHAKQQKESLKELKELSSQLEDILKERDDLLRGVEEKENQLTKIQALFDESMKQASDLREELLGGMTSEKDGFRRAMEEIRSELSMSEEKWKEESDQYEREILALKSEMKEKDEVISDMKRMRQEIDHLKKLLSDASSEVDRLKSITQSQEYDLEVLKEEKNHAENQLKSASMEHLSVMKQATASQDELRQSLLAKDDALADLKTALVKERDSKQALLEEKDGLLYEMGERESILRDENERLRLAIIDFERIATEHETSMLERVSKIDELTKRVASLLAENEDLHQTISRMDHDEKATALRMEDSKRATEREREEAIRMVESLTRDLELARGEQEKWKDSVDEVEKERDDLRGKVNTSHSSLKTLEDECLRYEEELKETKKLLDEEKGRSSEWEMKHEERLEEIEKLKKKHDEDLAKNMASLEETHRREMESKTKELGGKLSEHQKELAEMKKKYAESIETLKKSYDKRLREVTSEREKEVSGWRIRVDRMAKKLNDAERETKVVVDRSNEQKMVHSSEIEARETAAAKVLEELENVRKSLKKLEEKEKTWKQKDLDMLHGDMDSHKSMVFREHVRSAIRAKTLLSLHTLNDFGKTRVDDPLELRWKHSVCGRLGLGGWLLTMPPK